MRFARCLAALVVLACSSCESCFVDRDCADCGGCPTGLFDCGSGCIDIDVDTQNCGVCGLICQAGETCAEGECVPPAVDGATRDTR
ncbi:MAG: hypothetical protein IT379_05975 [Deltaproteobacteria bacterium]|nr:hypothetical protein [Deltaproteobacteria bacterium]